MTKKIQTKSGTQYHITGNKITRISEVPLYHRNNRVEPPIIGREIVEMGEPIIGQPWRFKYIRLDGESQRIVTSMVQRVWE